MRDYDDLLGCFSYKICNSEK